MIYFGTYTYYTSFIEIACSLFTHIGDLSGELFLTPLCIPDLLFKFRDVDRCIDILLYNLFTDDNRVLKVISSPRHESHKHISAKCKFTILSITSHCNRLTLDNLVANAYNRTLVNGCILLTSFKFLKRIGFNAIIKIAVFFEIVPVVLNTDLFTAYIDNFTISFS